MAKFRYTEPHRKSVVLQGDGDAAPYAVFEDGIFVTDDKKIIDRLASVPEVEAVQDEADAEPAQIVSQTE